MTESDSSPTPSKAVDFIKHHSVFTDLSHAELELVARSLDWKEYAPGEYVIHEHDESKDIYFIEKGEAEVLKINPKTQQEFAISRLQEGDMIGEMAFIDGQPRSSSIRIINRPASIYKLPVDGSHPELAHIYDKIFGKATQLSLSRLRATNQNFIQNFKEQIREVDEHNHFGYFFIFFITLFNLTSIAERFLLAFDVTESQWLSMLIYSVILLIPTIAFLRYTKYPLADFGITFQGAGPALKEACMLALAGTLVGGATYYLFDRSLFYENVTYAYRSFFTWHIAVDLLYCFATEIAIRGAIQSSLQKFLYARNKAQAIWLIALFLWPSDLYMGFQISFIDFLINLFLGAVFLRQRNVAGVIFLRFVIIILTQYG